MKITMSSKSNQKYLLLNKCATPKTTTHHHLSPAGGDMCRTNTRSEYLAQPHTNETNIQMAGGSN